MSFAFRHQNNKELVCKSTCYTVDILLNGHHRNFNLNRLNVSTHIIGTKQKMDLYIYSSKL